MQALFQKTTQNYLFFLIRMWHIALVFLLKPSTACRTGFTFVGENEPILKTAIASPESDAILFLIGIIARILSSLFCWTYKV